MSQVALSEQCPSFRGKLLSVVLFVSQATKIQRPEARIHGELLMLGIEVAESTVTATRASANWRKDAD